MLSNGLLVFCVFLLFGSLKGQEVKKACKLEHKGGSTKFPKGFRFGTATAAYQVEGAWNEDGRGPSIWDTLVHTHPEKIDDQSNGDVAVDSYHRFDQDLAALKDLNVSIYRFSISWSRILPNGEISTLNQKGIDYYNMVIDKLIANNIEPMVTMYHWDLPEEISKLGGFANPLIIEYFFYYADTLFKHFGDRVKKWITFNEPKVYCGNGYGNGDFAPNIVSPGVAENICMDTTVKAHGLVYRHYREKYFEQQQGKVGITLNSDFFFALNSSEPEIVDRSMQFSLGWLGHPIYSDKGNYPEVMLQDALEQSIKKGTAWPSVRPLKQYWVDIIKGAADFFGLNYYSSLNARTIYPKDGEPYIEYTRDDKWRKSKASWLYCIPEGLEGMLKWIRENYNNVEVHITENGWSDDGTLEDDDRIDYMKAHLQAILNSINSGSNIVSYMHWSLVDNFEWLRGYTEKFGLHYVNRSSENFDRIPKKSAHYYKKVIETYTIPDSVSVPPQTKRKLKEKVKQKVKSTKCTRTRKNGSTCKNI